MLHLKLLSKADCGRKILNMSVLEQNQSSKGQPTSLFTAVSLRLVDPLVAGADSVVFDSGASCGFSSRDAIAQTQLGDRDKKYQREYSCD